MNRTDLTSPRAGLARKTESIAQDRPVLGVPAGSSILTNAGELPIEYVGAGDKAITRDRGMAEITQIDPVDYRGPVVRLTTGTFGKASPDREVMMPADQLILLRDWRAKMLFGVDEVMVPLHRLVDDEFITLIPNGQITLFQISLTAGHILYANGLETAISAPNP